MTTEEQKQLEEEKKLVSKKLMKWDTCNFTYWNPQDPDKATCTEWNDIYSKMDEEFEEDFLQHVYALRTNDYTGNKLYLYCMKVSVDIKWKALLNTIKSTESSGGWEMAW